MFALFFLRAKYGPPIVALAGVALMAVGLGALHHVVTGIIGAASGVMRKKRGDLRRGEELGR